MKSNTQGMHSIWMVPDHLGHLTLLLQCIQGLGTKLYLKKTRNNVTPCPSPESLAQGGDVHSSSASKAACRCDSDNPSAVDTAAPVKISQIEDDIPNSCGTALLPLLNGRRCITANHQQCEKA